ncbi:sulfite reductase subunit alpha [Sediminicurvatus halobius]|uniref:assimilatory sulfite reductase (NADPH) n=1 Tax=Sediminicurvatus halobius TaxID=2182432 RepID=A0A2U2MYG1_9GAMM|nr:sulfite reductase subunit alpha [Spiribacter halobius]PWG61966.1 sulfite reductase subunit alpha [Spiribacter halobius]UEX78373.1 sulfite reductase subunit alpha [Spiribacter halobius]
MNASVIPRSAPFSEQQRQWLAAIVSERFLNPGGAGEATTGDDGLLDDLDSAPWHDMDLPLEERMALVPEGGPFLYRIMAAMAQQDCGQCGYDCKGYAQALVEGREPEMGLCVPGGPTTRKQVKALFEAHGPVAAAAEAAPLGPVGQDPRNPWHAPVNSVYALHGEGAPKDTRHVVIDLAGSGLTYRPGDSLGVYPQNDPALVASVIGELGAAAETEVTVKAGIALRLDEALRDWLDITAPSDEVLELLAAVAGDAGEARALAALAEEGLDDSPLDVFDVLRRHPSARPDVQAFVDRLGRLRPRLYSIASSQSMHPEEVHLTVGVVRYEAEARQRKGVASNFLAERAAGREVPIYLQPAKDFAVPEDDRTPIIMVGPGTGIAPFRGFLEERHARGASGGAWLFFGNPHRESDFLYQEELEGYLEAGTLTRLATAFSRDGERKVYVQDRMREHGAELWSWLQAGACFYVCGDAEHMAPAVDTALRDVIREHGGADEESARDYLRKLARQGRYQRDVY